MSWQDNFQEGQEIILATASQKGIPNANIVVSLGFWEGKLLIADCQMNTTIKNLQENNHICVIGGYIRLSGTVEIFKTGRCFDVCAKKSKGYSVKNAILVDIRKVFDLDKALSII